MNQGFKLRYDQMRDSDPTPSDANTPSTQRGIHEFYPTPGHTRNVCLVWPDGRRLFLNYAYLIAGEFIPDSDRNVIKLSFSSHSVSLKGYSLEILFTTLLDHLPRLIVAVDPRYVLEDDNTNAIVVEMVIEKKDD